jgi:hypothetical protein
MAQRKSFKTKGFIMPLPDLRSGGECEKIGER